MGEFDKKRGFGFGFGVVVGVVVGATSFLANVSEIVQLFQKEDKPEKNQYPVAVVEEVEKDVEDTTIKQAYINDYDYAEAEVLEGTAETFVFSVEEEDNNVEETMIKQTYVIKNGDDYTEAVKRIKEQEDLSYNDAEQTLIEQAYINDYNYAELIPHDNTVVFIESDDKCITETVIEQK
ncbi:MAG: hypothetical protein K2L10_02850 [Ruminococcus sp.]|nr:hypothetical protein [Ruminococcus sp.]